MASMITKLYTMHVVVNVQVLLKLPVLFAEIRPPKLKKIQFVHIFGLTFGFSVYVKALTSFKAF